MCSWACGVQFNQTKSPMRSGESRLALLNRDVGCPPKILLHGRKKGTLREKLRQGQSASRSVRPVFETAGSFFSEVKIDWGGLFIPAFLVG